MTPVDLSRRDVLKTVPAVALAGLGTRLNQAAEPAKPERLKVAALVTEFRPLSHAEVILDRILEGYGWEGAHYRPKLDLVALYVDQTPETDLSRERASRFKDLKIYPTIAAALCRGGDQLAVDGVILIGEHGRYPSNDRGQTLYPRYEFFEQTVDVFRKSQRSVPVFNDKHLSWSFEKSKKMVDTARELGFPFWAASSVPISWRIPSVEMPLGAPVEEALAVGNGNVDSYDFHVLETIQALVERRPGGETGVTHVQALRGDAVWQAAARGNWAAGGWDPALLEACLCRSHQLTPAREGFNHVYPTLDDLRRMVADPVAYRIEYADGLKSTMLLLNGIVGDITFAARIKDQPEVFSTQCYLGPSHDQQPHNFDPLVWHIEQFLFTGKPSHPIERTLLTSGLVTAGCESLFQKQARLATPQLAIRYQPNPHSVFRRM